MAPGLSGLQPGYGCSEFLVLVDELSGRSGLLGPSGGDEGGEKKSCQGEILYGHGFSLVVKNSVVVISIKKVLILVVVVGSPAGEALADQASRGEHIHGTLVGRTRLVCDAKFSHANLVAWITADSGPVGADDGVNFRIDGNRFAVFFFQKTFDCLYGLFPVLANVCGDGGGGGQQEGGQCGID